MWPPPFKANKAKFSLIKAVGLWSAKIWAFKGEEECEKFAPLGTVNFCEQFVEFLSALGRVGKGIELGGFFQLNFPGY